MSSVLLVVLILLTLGVAVLALYTLGTGRLVSRALAERPTELVFAAGAFDGNGPRVGDPAPRLDDDDSDGQPKASVVERLVLFAESGCQPCAVLAADLARRPLKTDGRTLVAVLDDADFAQRFRDEWTVIVDPSWHLAGAWHISGTPHATLIDHHGKVTHNTVVNTRKEVQRLIHSAPRQ